MCLNLPKLGARRGINQNPVVGVFPLKSHPTSQKNKLWVKLLILKRNKNCVNSFFFKNRKCLCKTETNFKTKFFFFIFFGIVYFFKILLIIKTIF